MRVLTRLSAVAWVLLAVLTAAVAGITHVGAVLALPWRSTDDAFARIAALVPPGTRTMLPAPDGSGSRLPFGDPAMLTAVCRFDLRTAPFSLSTSPFGDSFVSVGFHSRHGLAFYGLTVRASDASSLELVLGTADAGRGTDDGPRDLHQVAVTAPEPEGFVRKFIFSIDAKVIGVQYLITGGIFFIIAGLLAELIRTQLLTPNGVDAARRRLRTERGGSEAAAVRLPVGAGVIKAVGRRELRVVRSDSRPRKEAGACLGQQEPDKRRITRWRAAGPPRRPAPVRPEPRWRRPPECPGHSGRP